MVESTTNSNKASPTKNGNGSNRSQQDRPAALAAALAATASKPVKRYINPFVMAPYTANQVQHQSLDRKRSATVSSVDSIPIQSVLNRELYNPSSEMHIHTEGEEVNDYGITDSDDKTDTEDATIRPVLGGKPNSLTTPTLEPHFGFGRPPVVRKRSATTSIIENAYFPEFDYNEEDEQDNAKSPTWLLSDLLSNLGSIRDTDEYTIVAKANDLVLLFQQHPKLKNELEIKTVLPKIQFMLYHPVSEVRSSGYRILRYMISNYESLSLLIQSKLLIYLIVSLSGANSTLVEMEQALKLIREFLHIDKGTDFLSTGVIKALIAIVESGDDEKTNYGQSMIESIPESFKNVCLETICEMTIFNPELVFHSGGFKVIINSILEGSVEISSTCLIILLKLCDFQNSRKFIRNGFDLDSLISIFSNIVDDDDKVKKVSNSKLQKISFLIATLLKNFNGLIAFSIENFTSINNLVINLHKKNSKIRDFIMDIFLDCLGIQVFPWLENSAIGNSITRFNEFVGRTSYSFTYPHLKPIEHEFEQQVVNHYYGLLALVLIRNDIFDRLVDIIEQNSNESNTKKATLLLTHLYAMANSLLPPELIRPNMLLRDLSLHATFKIITRDKFQPKPDYLVNMKSTIKKINIESRYNIDDTEFKTKINNTKILTIKEFEEWNWTLLVTLIQGPLSNPKRFDEVLEKYPKFFKRLMSFYRPFKFRFSNTSLNNRNSMKYINIGTQLLEMFLNLDNGTKYLASSKLLPQLAEIVAQVDPYSGISSKEPLLNKKRLDSTCCMGYLRFIGILSAKPSGIQMLEHWQFFTLFLHIIDHSSESESNNLFIITLFKNVDFTINSRFRILLEQASKISNVKVRSYLLKHLYPSLIKIKECESFIIKILVTSNLYDSNHDIAINTVDLLYSFYSDNDFANLNTLVGLSPSISVLSQFKNGRLLLIHFMKIPIGFKYLEQSGYIDQEFSKWDDITDFQYLKKVELLIKYQLFPFLGNFEDPQINDCSLSVYFFKYLLTTEEGLGYFNHGKGRDFLELLINSITDSFEAINTNEEYFDIENQDEEHINYINKLKQNLWIIGNIAQGHYGIQLLDPLYNLNLDHSVIDIILDNFNNCPVWSLRGVCFFIIGMISSTSEGIEILDEYNWISVLDEYENSKGLAYPQSPNGIFNVEITNPYRDTRYYHIFNVGSTTTAPSLWGISNNESVDTISTGEESGEDSLNVKVNERVITLLHHLNSILASIENRAIKELNRMKQASPELFSDVGLFLEVIKLIDKGNFKLQKRIFIFGLFNMKILENLLKPERRGSFR
ncbi:uncharacterized protein SPAPADRAFT_70226 [Spathaspora passalidarum NRRL Y-27907]|uniref:Uncharacterized protein n=1 Tax=Spathaspora passalidarum (strain NRRL Y-27907 / 11-Y1) TaxID=619300 RepID=G3AJX3_SPAPN|nr:uncharacterized protein SPAPADRAFT_70226 [Spathaspora passalidarum NRRL Y-27907]EGW34024.1 hypothetical protein SPAPADRAFT_70226 [Spathaspora passalidarum NRRL Y-27907]